MSSVARPFAPAWLAGEPEALALLPGDPRLPASRAEAVGRASCRRVDPAVLEALSATTTAQRESREALARPGSAAVVTGQQAGLFGGPLYTIYKAASAIVDARALTRETGTPCVPIFWIQNEDHDFQEIASCRVLGADGALRTISVPEDPAEAGRSISARTLGPGIADALDAVAERLAGLSGAAETVALLRRCYSPDVSPDRAFRELIETLFAPHGLLVLDPCDPTLREAALPVHRRAVDEAQAISAVLSARSEALATAGFAVQVHVRPGSPLSFFHPDGPRGPRRRFDGPWPDRGSLSTSALLRPILQDTWLPTAAYVGGPGEIAYFAQLPPLYAAFGLPMPLVVPRARFRVIDETSDRLMTQLGVGADALGAPRDTLLSRLARDPDGHPDPSTLEASLLEPFREALGRFQVDAGPLDKGLLQATEKTRATVSDAVARLVERYRRVLSESDRVTVDRLDRLLARLAPDGAPQERVHAWPWFAARYGIGGFVAAALGAVVPFDGGLLDLRP